MIHRDWNFRGNELQMLEKWGASIGATFLCCEIRKRHIPRNHGSLLQPRLPVTVHYSDKIANLALQGIKPNALEGDRPYWL